jgi:hypothetical protein
MRLLYAAVAGLLACGLLSGSDPAPAPKPSDAVTIETVQPVTADLGKKCVVEVKTTAKKVTWRLPAGIDSVPLTTDGKKLAVWAMPGSYTLMAYAPSGDDVVVADVLVTITGTAPTPGPVDQLLKDLQAAYNADTGATKKDDIAKLAEVMAGSVASAKSGGKVKMTADLQNGVHQVTELVIPGKLKGVRSQIGAYLTPKLGSSSVPVTDAFWATASTEYAAVASALGKVVK